jgi:sec-independent protein translocase protein TatB
MFGIGFSETCIIAIAAFLLIGPEKLPNFMREVGGFFVRLRRFSNEIKLQVDDAMRKEEKKIENEHKEGSFTPKAVSEAPIESIAQVEQQALQRQQEAQ